MYYELVDIEVELDPNSQYVISKDDMDAKELDAVHKFFPFTQMENSESFKCPNWAK